CLYPSSRPHTPLPSFPTRRSSDLLLRLLQEGLEVPHPQEAGDEPGRVELLQVLDLLPDAHEHDRGLRLRDRAQGPAAFRRAVQQIGRAHVRTPVTFPPRMPSSA